MATLPDRTTDNTAAEHVADHNALHGLYSAVGGTVQFQRPQAESLITVIDNTTAQVDLVSFTLTAGEPQENDRYVFTVICDIHNATAGPVEYIFRFKRDGAVLSHSGGLSVPDAGTDYRAVIMEWRLVVDEHGDLNTFSSVRVGGPKTAGLMTDDLFYRCEKNDINDPTLGVASVLAASVRMDTASVDADCRFQFADLIRYRAVPV